MGRAVPKHTKGCQNKWYETTNLNKPNKGKPHTVNQRPGLVLGSTMGAGERRTLVREEGMGSPT